MGTTLLEIEEVATHDGHPKENGPLALVLIPESIGSEDEESPEFQIPPLVTKSGRAFVASASIATIAIVVTVVITTTSVNAAEGMVAEEGGGRRRVLGGEKRYQDGLSERGNGER